MNSVQTRSMDAVYFRSNISLRFVLPFPEREVVYKRTSRPKIDPCCPLLEIENPMRGNGFSAVFGGGRGECLRYWVQALTRLVFYLVSRCWNVSIFQFLGLQMSILKKSMVRSCLQMSKSRGI